MWPTDSLQSDACTMLPHTHTHTHTRTHAHTHTHAAFHSCSNKCKCVFTETFSNSDDAEARMKEKAHRPLQEDLSKCLKKKKKSHRFFFSLFFSRHDSAKCKTAPERPCAASTVFDARLHSTKRGGLSCFFKPPACEPNFLGWNNTRFELH